MKIRYLVGVAQFAYNPLFFGATAAQFCKLRQTSLGSIGQTMQLADNAALIIIDQQQGLDNPKLRPRNNPDAATVMLKLLNAWRVAEMTVIHVRHRSREPDSVFWPHQQGFEFKPDFLPQGDELVIEKNIPCAMLTTNLEKILDQKNIRELVLIGASTNNSIEATARTASGLGFKVFIVEDGCFAFEKADYFGAAKTAQEVHAMSLANLDGEYAQVLNSRDLLCDVKSFHTKGTNKKARQ
ncbi:cysteine hydrolase family protein [Cellvibrio sp.]